MPNPSSHFGHLDLSALVCFPGSVPDCSHLHPRVRRPASALPGGTWSSAASALCRWSEEFTADFLTELDWLRLYRPLFSVSPRSGIPFLTFQTRLCQSNDKQKFPKSESSKWSSGKSGFSKQEENRAGTCWRIHCSSLFLYHSERDFKTTHYNSLVETCTQFSFSLKAAPTPFQSVTFLQNAKKQAWIVPQFFAFL